MPSQTNLPERFAHSPEVARRLVESPIKYSVPERTECPSNDDQGAAIRYVTDGLGIYFNFLQGRTGLRTGVGQVFYFHERNLFLPHGRSISHAHSLANWGAERDLNPNLAV